MHCCMCFTPECRLIRIYNQGNEAFSKSQSRERYASRFGYIQTKSVNVLCPFTKGTIQIACKQMRSFDQGTKVYKEWDSNPQKARYGSRRSPVDLSSWIAVCTFINFFKAPFNGGIRTHDTRSLEQVNPQLYE